MSLPEICIRRPGLRDGDQPDPDPAGHRHLRPPDGAGISEHRRAGGLGGHDLSRRRPRDHRDPGDAGAGRLDRRHRRASTSCPPPAVRKAAGSPSASAQNIDPEVAASRRARPGRGACGAGCPTRSTSRSSPRSRPMPQPIIYLAFTSDRMSVAGHHRLHRPLRRRPVEEPARRGRGPDPGRAPLRDAHLDRPRPAGRLQPDRPGRRGRDPRPEHRGSGRADREQRPRVHRAVPHRADHAGAVRHYRRQGWRMASR